MTDRLWLPRIQLAAHVLLSRLGYGITHYRHPARTPALAAARKAHLLAHTATTPLECVEIYNAVKATENVPGEMAELGVYRGGTAVVILEAAASRQLHLFDTFTGVPHDEGIFSAGDYAASLSSVRKTLEAYKGRVEFHPGRFPDSAASVGEMRFSFVHLDADLYDATLAALRFFWPRLSVGGILLSHDYPVLDGIVRAFNEYFADEAGLLVPLSGNQCMAFKTA